MDKASTTLIAKQARVGMSCTMYTQALPLASFTFVASILYASTCWPVLDWCDLRFGTSLSSWGRIEIEFGQQPPNFMQSNMDTLIPEFKIDVSVTISRMLERNTFYLGFEQSLLPSTFLLLVLRANKISQLSVSNPH